MTNFELIHEHLHETVTELEASAARLGKSDSIFVKRLRRATEALRLACAGRGLEARSTIDRSD